MMTRSKARSAAASDRQRANGGSPSADDATQLLTAKVIIERSASKTSPEPEDKQLPAVVRAHDWFNLVALGILNLFMFYYLYTGRGFFSFYTATMVYFFADIIFVGVFPQSVKSPVVILAHHIVTAVYILIPYHYPKYEWCMAACMLVEVNTWLLIAKRTFTSKILEGLFYITWFGLRNVWYPYLIYVFYLEWKEETAICGTPWNPILITPVFQTYLTGLNFWWTKNLLFKKAKAKQL